MPQQGEREQRRARDADSDAESDDESHDEHVPCVHNCGKGYSPNAPAAKRKHEALCGEAGAKPAKTTKYFQERCDSQAIEIESSKKKLQGQRQDAKGGLAAKSTTDLIQLGAQLTLAAQVSGNQLLSTALVGLSQQTIQAGDAQSRSQNSGEREFAVIMQAVPCEAVMNWAVFVGLSLEDFTTLRFGILRPKSGAQGPFQSRSP